MYLSRLRFDRRHPGALRRLSDPYEMHRFIWHAFPDDGLLNQRGSRDILWRVEPPDKGNPGLPPTLIVQSAQQPDWGRPDISILLRPPEVKEWIPEFREGQRLRFRLRANPTRRIHQSETIHNDTPERRKHLAEKGMRVALLKEAEQIDWLVRQSNPKGFRVSDVVEPVVGRKTEENRDQNNPRVWFTVQRWAGYGAVKRSQDETHRMRWHGVDFEGDLEIADSRRFSEALANGIGPAKAFGFGLLSVAPVR